MQLIRVIENEQKPFGKKNAMGQKLTFEMNGKQRFINVFDSHSTLNQVMALVPGDELEVEIGKDDTGKYDVITVVGPVYTTGSDNVPREVIPSVGEVIKTPYTNNQESQRKSIERQVSLKSAVELVIGSGIKQKSVADAFNEVLKCAEGFYSYLTYKDQE